MGAGAFATTSGKGMEKTCAGVRERRHIRHASHTSPQICISNGEKGKSLPRNELFSGKKPAALESKLGRKMKYISSRSPAYICIREQKRGGKNFLRLHSNFNQLQDKE
jgi:hypothetical protein